MDFLEIAKTTVLTNDNIQHFNKLLQNQSPTKEEATEVIMRGLFFASRLPVPISEENKLPISSVLNYIYSHVHDQNNSKKLFQNLVNLSIISIDDLKINSGKCFISPEFEKKVLSLKDQLKIIDQQYKLGQEPFDD